VAGVQVSDIMNIVIIGIGGIGTHLLYPLLQYLRGEDFYENIILVDGDKFESKNKDRQIVPIIGVNKADATARYYRELGFELNSYPEYLTKDNIKRIIHEGDVVLVCVDNNATRKMLDISLHGYDELTVISGGNELHDGNVQVVQVKEGMHTTPTMIENHPEIGKPTDKNPNDMSCQELQHSQPQISVVNAGIADIMRRVFFGLHMEGIDYNETYVNFKNGNIRNVKLGDGKRLRI